jgi:hypothetical protein
MGNNFDKMTKEEKVIIMMYKKKIEQEIPIEKFIELAKKSMEIHFKYPDFLIDEVP